MSRWKAASIHLGISALIAGIALALLLGLWYPPPWFQAEGGLGLLKLLVGVDVVLGPLLTLAVFKSGKPGLKFDLAVIGIMQALALAYGLHVMLVARPVFLVAAKDRFVLVAANDLDPKDVAEASRPEWRHFSWTGPVLVGTKPPTGVKESNELVFSALAGKDIQEFPRYYAPYTDAWHGLLKYAHPLSRLRQMHPDHAAEIDVWIAQHQVDENNAVWLPVVAHKTDLAYVLDKTTGTPLGTIALDPWESGNADK
jgi:hypothetical protein